MSEVPLYTEPPRCEESLLCKPLDECVAYPEPREAKRTHPPPHPASTSHQKKTISVQARSVFSRQAEMIPLYCPSIRPLRGP